MNIKLFGVSLFSAGESKASAMLEMASQNVRESKYLADFYTMTEGTNFWENPISIDSIIAANNSKKKGAKKKVVKKKAGPTPKGVFEMKLLHDETFVMNTDEKYIEQQLSDFKDKLALIKSEEYDMRRGTVEIGSIIARFENRKKYSEHKNFYEQFPYTAPSRIADVLKKHDHLKMGQVAQFLADMPKEATDVMKAYEARTIQLCDKKPVYYIIADKKDFQKAEKRRDPILLAQSPFGHFWQILGAWDEEMLLLEEL